MSIEDNIWFCGDPHGKFKHIIEAVTKLKPKAIVLLGDNIGEENSTKFLSDELKPILNLVDIYWIYGNHETDYESTTHLLFNDPVLKDKNIHGKVVDMHGVKIAGLGGNFKGKVWNPKDNTNSEVRFRSFAEFEEDMQRQLSTKDAKGNPALALKLNNQLRTARSAIFYEDYERMSELSADVLVTHEAPSCHPYGFKELEELAQFMSVRRTFHGHQHDDLDYSTHHEAFGHIPRGVGLRGITTLSGKVIVKGELDDNRKDRNK